MKPKIRFSGYNEEWENSPFPLIFEPLKNNSLSRAELTDNGSVKNIHYGDVLIKYGECLDANNEDVTYIKDNDLASRLLKTGSLQNGDVVFADAAEDNTVGKCTEVIAGPEVNIVSGLHTIPCRPKKNFASMYLGYSLNSESYHEQLIPLIQGTKISSISKRALSQTNIKYPKSKTEQQAISEYFKQLDSVIASTGKKVEALKQVKAASMQSMFPQEGETTPRIRFKGFSDAYKTVKAHQLFKKYDERNHPELPVLSACQDIRGMSPRSESGYDISHDRNNERTYKRVLPGQFVIHLRSFQGGFAHSSVEGICSPAYSVFKFKDDGTQDDYYWKYIFMSVSFIDSLKKIT